MRVFVLIAVMALTGCSAANDVADTIARDRAKTVVNGVVEQRFPGVNAAPVTDCIIDAASAGDILSLARDSLGGVQPAPVELVVDIASRPAPVQWIAANSMR